MNKVMTDSAREAGYGEGSLSSSDKCSSTFSSPPLLFFLSLFFPIPLLFLIFSLHLSLSFSYLFLSISLPLFLLLSISLSLSLSLSCRLARFARAPAHLQNALTRRLSGRLIFLLIFSDHKKIIIIICVFVLIIAIILTLVIWREGR